MFKKTRGLTLIELLVSLIILSLIIVGIYNIETFSNSQVIDSDHRAKVQNDLAFALEHMSKYIQQGNGNITNPAIVLVAGSGFKVRVDLNSPQTPSDLSDDAWVSYLLSGNNLNTSCTGSCSTFSAETLSKRIVSGFSNSVMPVGPASGFYVSIDPLGNLVDIGLVGRYDPTKPVISATTRFINPQIEMKTRVISNSSSSH